MPDPDLESLHDAIARDEDSTTQREAFELAVTADDAPDDASERATLVGDADTDGSSEGANS